MTVYCDYCGHKAALVDDSEIYGRSFGHTAYLCRNCGAYVGCHGRTDKPLGAGIIMDVDLEQLIRESERLRVCKAIFNSSSIENWHLRDALEAVLAEPSVAPASNDVPEPCIPAQEADHA